MNFSQLLLEFLKKEDHASIPGFGVFSLKTAHAVVDKQHILPPRQEIFFSNDVGDINNNFIEFYAGKKKLSLLAAEDDLKKQVNFWAHSLEKEGKLTVESLGSFYLDDSKIHFKDERSENSSPDFYGLEELNISKIKKFRQSKSSETTQEYGFSKYWLLPLLIGVLAITYIGITQPEKIFGKKSFDFEKKPVSKIVNDALKKDSLKTKENDSLKMKKDQPDSAKALP